MWDLTCLTCSCCAVTECDAWVLDAALSTSRHIQGCQDKACPWRTSWLSTRLVCEMDDYQSAGQVILCTALCLAWLKSLWFNICYSSQVKFMSCLELVFPRRLLRGKSPCHWAESASRRLQDVSSVASSEASWCSFGMELLFFAASQLCHGCSLQSINRTGLILSMPLLVSNEATPSKWTPSVQCKRRSSKLYMVMLLPWARVLATF